MSCPPDEFQACCPDDTDIQMSLRQMILDYAQYVGRQEVTPSNPRNAEFALVMYPEAVVLLTARDTQVLGYELQVLELAA
jgi:hypothetical protein